jgi:hypothetical protein
LTETLTRTGKENERPVWEYTRLEPEIANSNECHYIIRNSRTRNGAIPVGLLNHNETMGKNSLFHYCSDQGVPGVVKTYRGVFLLSRAEGGDGTYIPGTHGRVKRDLILAARARSIGRRSRCSPSGVLQNKSVTVGVWPYWSGPWDTFNGENPGTCSPLLLPHHSSCSAHAPSQSNSLPPLSRAGSGYRWTRGDGTKPVFAIKPERPSFSPSSLISGTPAWGVLDYAVHTFLAFFL